MIKIVKKKIVIFYITNNSYKIKIKYNQAFLSIDLYIKFLLDVFENFANSNSSNSQLLSVRIILCGLEIET